MGKLAKKYKSSQMSLYVKGQESMCVGGGLQLVLLADITAAGICHFCI